MPVDSRKILDLFQMSGTNEERIEATASDDDTRKEATLSDSDMHDEAPADDTNTTATIDLLREELAEAKWSINKHQREIGRLQAQNQQLLKSKRDAVNDAKHWRTKHDAKAADLTEAKSALFDA